MEIGGTSGILCGSFSGGPSFMNELSGENQGVGGSCFNHFCFRFKVVGHAQLPTGIHQSKHKSEHGQC